MTKSLRPRAPQPKTPNRNYLPRASAPWIAALITQWRQSASTALTGDEGVTYTECAGALEAASGIRFLEAICEGCGTREAMPEVNAHKVYPGLPSGWSQCGQSKHRLDGHGKRLAAWCPECRALNQSSGRK